MAKRRLESEEGKKPLTKDGLKKFVGVFRFVGPYRWSFIMGLFALTLSTLTLLSFPFLGGKLLDVAQGKSWMFLHSVNDVIFILAGLTVVQGVFSFFRVYFFANVGERSLADLRHAIYEKIIWLPQTFFDSRRIGELTSHITSDVSTLQDAFSLTLAELLRQSLMLIIGILVILILTPTLTLFMLLTFPILVVAALFFGKFIRKLSKKTQDQLANSNVIVEETFQSIVVVKAFTNEVLEVLRYRKSLTEVVNTALYSARYRGFFISFIIITVFGGIVAVSWYGATLVHNELLTVGKLFSFVLYTGVIGASIAGLGDLYSQLQKAIGASERVLEILELKDEKSTDSIPVKLQGDITFNEVSFSYPTRADVEVLKSISFEVAAGEKIALVGPSGSGKSTIINLLMRFYPVRNGFIQIDSKNVLDYDLSAYRKNIGVVPQEVILFGGTIRENIAYGKPGASEEEILIAARKANALEFIESFPEKLDTIVGDRGVKLSGGQRQRVAIARAILKDPAILILDEATSSLDAKSERLVQEALEKLMENRTTVIIAHRLSTIRKADRIMVIKDGRIAESGTHDSLISMDEGIYSNLLKLQLEIEPS